MAYLEKKILVTIPVTEAHKTYLEKQASSGKYNCQFRYIPKEHVTKEDLEDTQVLIGNLPPALVREAKRLEWLQLNSAGADPYTPEGVLPAGAVLTSATGAYGLAVSEHMLALTFDLIRRLGQYHKNQADRQWRSMGNIISVVGFFSVTLSCLRISSRMGTDFRTWQAVPSQTFITYFPFGSREKFS